MHWAWLSPTCLASWDDGKSVCPLACFDTLICIWEVGVKKAPPTRGESEEAIDRPGAEGLGPSYQRENRAGSKGWRDWTPEGLWRGEGPAIHSGAKAEARRGLGGRAGLPIFPRTLYNSGSVRISGNVASFYTLKEV